MRLYEIKPELRKILRKLWKKDKVAYEYILKKIEEIMNSEDVDHYKNLRKPLHAFKRVHVRDSFVLIFRYVKSGDQLDFYYYGHHDNVYQWRPKVDSEN